MEQFVILRVINNNVVLSVDQRGNEVILKGKGIGFQKKVDDVVSKDVVEKVYVLSNSSNKRILTYFEEIPFEFFELVDELFVRVSDSLSYVPNQDAVFSLVDHIHFAIKRYKENLLYKNPLLLEIKTYYPNEFQAGLVALDLIEEKTGVRLPEDEAGFIALHFVNTNLGMHMDATYLMTELLKGVMDVVENYYGMPLVEGSNDYVRFITHLKFFGQRLLNNSDHFKDEEFLSKVVKQRYPKEYACALKVQEYILATFDKQIGSEEVTFLAIHLARLMKRS